MLYHNPFLFEYKTRVKSQDIDLVELEETIFYPGGGGQPCDLGFINDCEVLEVFKKEDRILHRIKGTVFGEVNLFVNKERRLRLIKMHTGEHILFKSLELMFGEIELVKIDLDQNESSLFIKANNLDWERLFKVEEMVNKVISEDRKIIEHEYKKEDAVKLGVRIKAERVPDIVRVVEVKDFDLSACAGIHVPSTKHIGNLIITKYNITKGNWELRFKTDLKDYSYYTNGFRLAIAALDTDEVAKAIERLKKESEDYKERFRKASSKLLEFNKEDIINGKKFIYNVTEGVEKKQLVDKSAELSKNAIVCFVNLDERNTVLLSADQSFGFDIPKLLNKALEKFNGKGGGKGSFAMGSFEGSPEGFLKEIRMLF